MPTGLARDDSGYPIQVLGYKLGGAQKLTANSATAVVSNAISVSTNVVTIFADNPVWFELSNSSSVAANSTSHYLTGSMYIDVKIRQQNKSDSMYFAFQNVSSNATVYISSRE